jgi:hypothetical protein
VDPLPAPLGNNGGFTQTLALLPGSPAIDSGDDAVCPATDQRGVRRPQGLACDIGSFELVPNLTLTRDSLGVVKLHYEFQASQTNYVEAGANLSSWLILGTGITETNGVFDFIDDASDQMPLRFYSVRP